MKIPRSATTILLAVLLAAMTAGAQADQRDDRLDRLFLRLQGNVSAAEGQRLEQRIWEIWLQSDDGEANRLMLHGVAAMHSRDYARALDLFDELIVAAPDFAEAWNRRATLYYLTGDYAASVRDIQQTLSLEPRHFGALSGLGMIYDRLGQPEAALKSFEAALDLNPHLAGPRERAAELRREIAGQRT
jgi:tetratricopeptide (TPR) repeat protein